MILSGESKVDVLSQIWEQDEAALGAFVSKLSEIRSSGHPPATAQR